MSLYVKDLGSGAGAVNSTTQAITLSATPASTNSVVLVGCCTSTQTLSSVADSKGNTWTVDASVSESASAVKQSVAIAKTTQNTAALVSGDTVTMTFSATNSGKWGLLMELAGTITLDQIKTGTQTVVTSLTTGASPATTTATEIVIGAFAVGAAQTSWTADATYSLPTLNMKNNSAADRTLLVEYKDISATGAQTATGTAGTAGASANALATYSSTAASAPVNTVAPAVTGTTTVGQTLSCTTGTWTTSSPVYTYQWQRDVAGNSSYSNIGSATSSTYVLVDADDACHVRCVVTDTDANGATSANSNAVGVVAEPVPTISVAPTVSGTASMGSTLTSTTGTWTHQGGTVATYAYQWTRDGVNIGSATSSTYASVQADVGTAVGCKVTATNTGGAGSASSSSNTITVLPAGGANPSGASGGSSATINVIFLT